jgi:TatA/E family protein of Tat protein translocase
MKVLMLFLPESPMIWILVIGVIFLLFGGSKLPQLAKALGQSKKAFKEGIEESEHEEKVAKPEARSSLASVDDEALFEEARRRAQELRSRPGANADDKLLSEKSVERR